MNTNDRSALPFVIWCLIVVIVTASTLYAPAIQLMVDILKFKIHFVFVIVFPALGFPVWWVRRYVMGGDMGTEFFVNTSRLLVAYTLYVVLLTGGLEDSPMGALVALVPILTSTTLEGDNRRKLFYASIIGTVLLFLVAVSSGWFKPPAQYPKVGGWESTGKVNGLIALGTCLLGLVCELIMLAVPGRAKQGEGVVGA